MEKNMTKNIELDIKMRLNFDFETEKERLQKCFEDDPDVLERQLNILNLFLAGNLKETIEYYEDLPIGPDGYSEKEYVGIWFYMIIDLFQFSGFTITKIDVVFPEE
jgi:hypothetical protein